MSGFVSQESHRFLVGLYSFREVVFDFLESWISEVKRDANEWDPVGTSPLITEIDGWVESEILRVELRVKLLDHSLDSGSWNGEAELRYLSGKEGLAFGLPVGE